MSTAPRQRQIREVIYPSGDGKPMAETELHLHDMIESIQALEDRFDTQPNVYVCGNMLLYYEEGKPRKHVSPDVLVALGVAKKPPRDYYLVWKEGKAPDFVIEITSKSTKREDKNKKFVIYRDILRVSELFLFDPTEDYLHPPLQGFRLVGGEYLPIEPIAGRLPSEVVGLHLERDGEKLRLFDPTTGTRIPTRLEARKAAERLAEDAHRRAEDAHRRAEDAHRRAEDERRRAEDERIRAQNAEAAQLRLAEENERLRRELEALRRE
jgi:Uma2 family endonuclease